MPINEGAVSSASIDSDIIQPDLPPCSGFGGHPHPCTDRSLRNVSPQDRHRLIARLAYQKAERRGFAPGGEMEDWIEAEAQVGAGLDDG
jgi:hypothetical protein